jgi:hypothetical protein
MSRRGLQVILMILGVVALVFGTLAVVAGTALIPDGGEAAPSVDSELRFYAAWYAAAGVVLLRVARRIETEGATIRAICALFFVGGCGRVLSIIAVGTPHPFFVTLMAVELAIPAVIIPWLGGITRRSG